jgi:glycosyltransferase involved in cell wall biosynthesis
MTQRQPLRRVLLLSAYDAKSHRLWRESLMAMFPDWQWTVLALPARHFNWRVRGNSLSWAFTQQKLLEADYDLLIATSMVDLSSLRGFIPRLGNIHSIVYFHENQFAYPANSQPRYTVETQVISLYTALCADQLVFNSEFNKQTFLLGVQALLAKLPDRVPAGITERLADGLVLPVPLADSLFKSNSSNANRARSQTGILQIAWNHRWEYDKGPQLLLQLLQEIEAQGLPFDLYLAGEQFRKQPAEFSTIQSLLTKHRRQSGLPERPSGYIADVGQYHHCLSGCDVVLSTALQDFQGLALQEAVALGCTPLAPRRLVYPEYLAQEFLYQGYTQDEEVNCILQRLSQWQSLMANGETLPKADLGAFSCNRSAPAYAALFSRVAKA